MLSSLKPKISEAVHPLAKFLRKIGVTPNHLTIAGVFVGFLSAYFIATHKYIIGGVLLLLSGFFDMMDGALARGEGLSSDFGGFFDSVMDRYVDIIIFISLGISGVNWLYVTLALSGALLVSYTRARAEKIIKRCDVGIAERGERLLIIFLGLMISRVEEAVILVAILSHLTAVHRITYTKRALKSDHR
jgi:archaetidylinositol phosphate synthase